MSTSNFTVAEVRKALFTSPDKMTDQSGNPGITLNNRLQIEHEIDTALRNSQRDGHDQRMKKFRQLEKKLADDDWMYPPVEKLIGLK